MHAITIDSLESAVDVLFAMEQKEYQADKINIGNNLQLQIKLEGAQWSGQLDYRIAEFIIQLQKDFLQAYQIQTGENVRYKSQFMKNNGLIVHVEVKQGCTEILASLGEMAKNMTGKQILGGIISVALIWSAADVYKTKIKTQKEIALAKIEAIEDAEERANAQKNMERFFSITESTSFAISSLAKNMESDDILSINSGDSLRAEEAKMVFRNNVLEDEHISVQQYYIDGDYTVASINMQNDTCVLLVAGKKRKFSLVWLDETKKELFFKTCSKYKSDQPLAPMPLQVTVNLHGGVFESGFIHDLGNPRQNIVSYEDAVKKSIDTAEESQENQE